jgi:hypothetical protein
MSTSAMFIKDIYFLLFSKEGELVKAFPAAVNTPIGDKVLLPIAWPKYGSMMNVDCFVRQECGN